ncbi:MAG: quinone-dependent dihydroorotate dehydrogenase [Mucilaginibacter polytrichastri]|nr:quinone-dependent dihydroorotate dehydrogenase [Mucilaginibacter polytrichastri]
MYKLVRPLFFSADPEKIHHFVTQSLKRFSRLPGGRGILHSLYGTRDAGLKRTVFGLDFPNPVGLAAGFDKNAEYIAEMAALGFGFIEVGTVTPMPQPGNPKPRMFRLKKDEGLINRMGFNNLGVDVAADRIERFRRSDAAKKFPVIIGGNIGKNKNTPNEEAVSDYLKCFNRLFPVVDYFVVNVSSPNTPGLRDLQEKGPLTEILNTLQKKNSEKGTKPILLKIAPDLSDSQLDDIIEIVRETGIAGVIATNTTISRVELFSPPEIVRETGGLSGKPVRKRSTEVIRYLSERSGNAFPIIGVGGIHSAEDAQEKIDAGASLVQLYTGFIYEGPALVKAINKKIRA